MQRQFFARAALEVGDLAGDQLRIGSGIARHHPVELDEVDARGSGRALCLAGRQREQDAERRGNVLALLRELGEGAAAKLNRFRRLDAGGTGGRDRFGQRAALANLLENCRCRRIGAVLRALGDQVGADLVLNAGQRGRGGGDYFGDVDQHIACIVRERLDHRLVIRADVEAGAGHGGIFGRELEAGLVDRGPGAGPRGGDEHGQLVRGGDFFEGAAVGEAVLDLADEIGEGVLALLGGELRGDLRAGIGEAAAGGGLDALDLDHVETGRGLDRADHGAGGSGEDLRGDGFTGAGHEFGAGDWTDADVGGGEAGGRGGGGEGAARLGARGDGGDGVAVGQGGAADHALFDPAVSRLVLLVVGRNLLVGCGHGPELFGGDAGEAEGAAFRHRVARDILAVEGLEFGRSRCRAAGERCVRKQRDAAATLLERGVGVWPRDARRDADAGGDGGDDEALEQARLDLAANLRVGQALLREEGAIRLLAEAPVEPAHAGDLHDLGVDQFLGHGEAMLAGVSPKRAFLDQRVDDRIEVAGEVGISRLRVLLADLSQPALHGVVEVGRGQLDVADLGQRVLGQRAAAAAQVRDVRDREARQDQQQEQNEDASPDFGLRQAAKGLHGSAGILKQMVARRFRGAAAFLQADGLARRPLERN